MEYLVYGLAENESREYMETLLFTNLQTEQQIDKAKAFATSKGFHSLRVTTFNGEMPNFIKTIRA